MLLKSSQITTTPASPYYNQAGTNVDKQPVIKIVKTTRNRH